MFMVKVLKSVQLTFEVLLAFKTVLRRLVLELKFRLIQVYVPWTVNI